MAWVVVFGAVLGCTGLSLGAGLLLRWRSVRCCAPDTGIAGQVYICQHKRAFWLRPMMFHQGWAFSWARGMSWVRISRRRALAFMQAQLSDELDEIVEDIEED